MTDTRIEEARISELLWRTIKLRASLLIVAIIVLLIVWSAILSGNQRAVQTDLEYCQKLVAIENASIDQTYSKLHLTTPFLNVATTCSASGARSHIETQRGLNAIWRDILASFPKAEQKSYSDKEALFSEYDSKRKSSYDFEIQLSSQVSSSPISLNALTVAEVAPFLVLGIAAIVIVLGFQQSGYKVRLSQLAYESTDSTLSTLGRTQFFTFSAFTEKRIPRVLKWTVISVEGLAIGALAAALVATCFGLLLSFAENVVHLTDSITNNYVSKLFAAAFLLAWCLAYTRRAYRETLQPSVRSAPASASRFGESILVVVAFAALMLPWTTSLGGLSLKGYSFLFPERPTAGAIGAVFPISPQLFSELRWQLAIALTFVLCCGVECLFRRRLSPTAKTLLHASRGALAIVTLDLSLNLLLYMAILEYEAIRGTSWDVLNMFSNAALGHGAGLPLVLYDPSYGFFVFLIACFPLIRSSLRDLF